MEEREVEFVVCKQCETPCYNFEIHKGKIVSALCPVCGNDETDEFEIPKQ